MSSELEGSFKVFPYESIQEKGPSVTHRLPRLRSQTRIEKASVAQLTVEEITRMADGELARVIYSVEPFPNPETRLGCYGRSTLEQLAYLARQVCRRQGY